MRLRHLLAPALGLLLVACGGTKSSAAGTWVVDREAVRAMIESSLTPEQKKAMAEHPEAKQMMDKMMESSMKAEYELKPGGSIEARGESNQIRDVKDAHWSQDGNVVTITKNDKSTMTGELRDGKLYVKFNGVGPMSGKEVVFVRK